VQVEKMARMESLSIQPSLFDLFYEEFLNQFMAGSNPTTVVQGPPPFSNTRWINLLTGSFHDSMKSYKDEE
jgi:hypothetical protein